MKYQLQSILRRGGGLSLVSALILSCPAKVLPCNIEYSDWLVNVFRQQQRIDETLQSQGYTGYKWISTPL